MQRRVFLSGAAAAPALLSQRNPNDTLRTAVIGVGNRGFYLMQEFQRIPGLRIDSICDLYDGHLARAREFMTNTKASYTKEWERAVADPNIDAVVIATPDFWHAPMVIAAAKAKKDIYVEKAWGMSVDEAKRMRAAVKENGVVMQLGHNRNSAPGYHKARELVRAGLLGKAPLVRTYCDRGKAGPEWKFYGDPKKRDAAPADANAQTIDWNRFQANAPKRPFDVERFFRWRNWWEYGTGIAGDLMSHLWDATNLVLGMGIPESCVTHGAVNYWKTERVVPDIWTNVFDYAKRDLTVMFSSALYSNHYGDVVQLIGRDATVEVGSNFCYLYGAEWKPEHEPKWRDARRKGGQRAVPQPDISLKPGEIELTSHWQNFVDCVRTRQKPRCDVDRAFEECVTVAMSVEAFRKERKVKWDAVKEQMV